MEVREIALGQLIPSKNLRTEGVNISELTESIREHGLLQPIRIRPMKGGIYQIISGHRRYMAHKALDRKNIAAVVSDETDESAAVQGIVENLQREDLTPLELARGIQELVVGFQLDIEQAARAVSKSPDRVRTWLRIGNLPDDVLSRLESGEGRTQRVTGLAPRHIEPFVRGLPTLEEIQQNDSAATQYEEKVSDVRDLMDEVDRRGARITAHMADAIAKETRGGTMTVSDAMDKILADPSRYRYSAPTQPTPGEIEVQTFSDYSRLHSELLALAHKLRPEIAVSFPDDRKTALLDRLDSLNNALEPYRKALLHQTRRDYQAEPAKLDSGE